MNVASHKLADSDITQERMHLPPALVIAVHLAALVVFFFNPLIAGVLLAFAICSILAFNYPTLIAVFCVAFLWINEPIVDFYPMSQTTAWRDVLLVLVVCGWALRSAILHRPIILDHPISRPLLAVVALYLGSCILSPSLVQALLGLKATLFYMVWVLVLPDVIRTKQHARAVIIALLFAMVCLSVYNLWAVQQPFGTFPPGRDGRILPGILMVHWGGSGTILPIGIIFGMVIGSRLRLWRRLLVDGAVMLGMAGLVATTARSSWGILIAVAFLMAVLARKAGFARILIVALIAGAVVQSSLSLKVADRAESTFQENDTSAEAREVEFSTVSLPFVLTHPFGAGTGSMSARGSAQVWSGGATVDLLMHGIIHNGFLLVAIETGWLGLVAYIWLLAAATWSAWKAYLDSQDPLLRDLALASFGTLVFFTGMNFAAAMMTTANVNFDFWIIVGLVMLLPTLDKRAAEATRSLEAHAGS
jgi:O-antigen ligase